MARFCGIDAPWRHRLWLAPLLLLATAGFTSAVGVSDEVEIGGQHTDKVFAAGGSVRITAQSDDDIIATGGTVRLDAAAADHVIVAGGSVTLSDVQARDLILVGGEVDVAAGVANDIIVAGGRVRLRPATVVAGSVLVTAGRVVVAGDIGGDLRVTAGKVVIAGQVGGDAEITAGELRLAPGARVAGRLVHRGPEPPEVADPGAVAGGVLFEETEADEGGGVLSAVWSALLTALALGLVGLVLHALWPTLLPGAVARITARPGASLGFGLAALIGTPVAILLVMLTVIGVPLAVMLLACYAALMVPAALVSASWLAVWAKQRWRPPAGVDGLLMRSLLTGAGIFVLALLSALPWVGNLVVLLTLAFGLGALVMLTRDGWGGGQRQLTGG